MLLKTTLFTLFTIYCATVFASKYSITITSESPKHQENSSHSPPEENSSPKDNKINNDSIKIHLRDEPDSTDILEQIFKANALQFGDNLASPVFLNADQTKIDSDSDLIKGLFPESIGKMDDPTDFLDVIMKDGRFADVRHILKDIIEDIDEDEDEYDYEEDDENGYTIEDEDEDEDFVEEEDDDMYYIMENQLMNKRKKFITDGIPSTITSSVETQRNHYITKTTFFNDSKVSKDDLYNITTFTRTDLTFPKSKTITTHLPSRLFLVTSKTTEVQTRDNKTILKVERNLGTNREFYTFMKSIYFFTLIFLLILLYFDQ